MITIIVIGILLVGGGVLLEHWRHRWLYAERDAEFNSQSEEIQKRIDRVREELDRPIEKKVEAFDGDDAAL